MCLQHTPKARILYLSTKRNEVFYTRRPTNDLLPRRVLVPDTTRVNVCDCRTPALLHLHLSHMAIHHLHHLHYHRLHLLLLV